MSLRSTKLLTDSGVPLRVNGTASRYQNWQSSSRLFGASKWWNHCGIVGGYFANMNPDRGTIAQPDWPGARSSIYEDVGETDVVVTVVFENAVDNQAGPQACIVPTATEFSLGFAAEHGIGGWVLWEMGRQPDDIVAIATLPESLPSKGTPITMTMTVGNGGTTVTCAADGVDKFVDIPIPAALQGSTIHGLWVDANSDPARAPDVPAIAESSYTIVAA